MQGNLGCSLLFPPLSLRMRRTDSKHPSQLVIDFKLWMYIKFY